MKKKEIENSGILEAQINGGYRQEILFTLDKKNKFKISIMSERHTSQSYAKLFKWTDKEGFALVISKNPKTQYNIDVAYKRNVNGAAFKSIIDDLARIAETFVGE